VGLALGLLALGPGLRRGFLLSYDMVFVSREPLAAALPGLAPPRAVPSDLVIATLSRLLPADLVQKLILLAIFVLACSGAATLLDRAPLPSRAPSRVRAPLPSRAPLLACLAAGVFYAWNPYVGERLIIGQWALLLGYAGLPWVLRAVLALDLDSRRGAGRLALALLPAIIGGFAAMAITALVAVPAAVLSRGDDPPSPPRWGLTRSLRRAAVVLAALAVGSLPWLIPSLLHPVYVDPASVAAFAARADTPFGSLGSLLMLGGNWNAQTVPQAYGGPWSALWLAAVIVALAAYLLTAYPLRASQSPAYPSAAARPAATRRRWPGLGLAALLGLITAALGVIAPGRDLLRSLIAAWPGFAILRDAQQFVAPLALAEALGFGLAVAAALNHPRPLGTLSPVSVREQPHPEFPVRRAASSPLLSGRAAVARKLPGARAAAARQLPGACALATDRSPDARPAAAGVVLAVLALLLPVLLLPGLAWGAAGRLRPAWYPAAWIAAARSLDASPAHGSVLLLPWATYRTPLWNHGEVLLDPWTQMLSRPLIWNDGTQVGNVALAPDDPRARNLAAAITAGGPLTAALRAAGVRFVLDDADGPASRPPVAARLPGSIMIIDLPGLTVYQL
jgi:hypothetical protein